MRKLMFLSLLGIAVLFFGCGNQQQAAPPPAQPPVGQGNLVDGQYQAQFSAFDPRGWRPFLNLTVSGGRITEAQFDYVNAAGGLKSQDAAYNQRMAAASGTDVARFIVAANAALVQTQQIPIDTITGATTSTVNFNALVSPLLTQIVAGNRGMVVVPMDGIYAAETQPDQRGWIARLELQFQNDRIIAARYDEIQRDGNTVTARKSEDTAYGERWGQDVPLLYQGWADALVASQNPATVDGVSGATSAHNKFVELAQRIIQNRGN
jgi:major membrane immunogen (membrane-anchored lipoprotein)